MPNLFNLTAPTTVGRSVFNLSYTKKFTCDMGQLIPVLHDEVLPGDVWHISNQCVIRLQPMVAPLLHEVNAYVHYFFVPNRIIWDDWESFITGGEDGTEAPTLPVWGGASNAVGTLWDYMGMPTGVNPPTGFEPIDFQRRAYHAIYNEYYRAEELIAESSLTVDTLHNRAWEKDYFTSALLSQQRGVAPALPISGIIDIDSTDESVKWHNANDPGDDFALMEASGNITTNSAPTGAGYLRFGDPTGLEVDLSSATTVDVADMRLAFQQQKFLERNNRAGARYTEQLKAHYGVAPRDDRLDRPEYIGGTKQPVIFSEVLQTESSDASTPQGNMSGHGISVASNFVGTYRAKEHGIIMGIISVMPRTAYSQGIDRQWLKTTKYDYYFPEFANLSEQPVYEGEIYASATLSEDQTIFGYQGRYNEYRYKKDLIAGDMRSTYDYWHLGRQFSGRPTLNQTFVEAAPSTSIRKDIFAAPSADGLIINFGNILKVVRPMPIVSNPGLIDH